MHESAVIDKVTGLRSVAPDMWAAMARAIAPRKPMTVSEWADAHRVLSRKSSSMPGRWITNRNPILREPMDCMSARSPVREVVLRFPIQSGKTSVEENVLGYTMTEDPGPIMVCLPTEVSMNKWVAQKLGPMIEETEAVREVLTSVASRDASNTRTFKDFAGGQLYLEHAGSPSRLKSTSVKIMLVDEVDDFAANLAGGDDPMDMLLGRTSAFPVTYRHMFIGTPGIKGISRIDELFDASDQRRYHVPCPHCGHMQPLEWAGLKWSQGGERAWYVCRECGAEIEEHHKPAMLAAGRWVPEKPEAARRGYTINCLYYAFGLGPRWAELARMWLAAQNDTAKLKTFINDRLAESWEDPAMRAVRHNAIADRAEPYKLRIAPEGVLAITAGIDTQDDRLAVQIVGWGAGLAFWVLDYVELPGDPAGDAVWAALTDLLNRPIQHANGALLRVLANAHDYGGHRGEAVKHYSRQKLVRRHMPITGAVANTAPILGKAKLSDVNWRGRTDRRGVAVWQVGTVAAKHWLFGRLSTDADKDADQRLTHFSDELDPSYFAGLVSESFNPAKNRFEKRRGARNEPLDTWVYAFAAAHHPELRLHRHTRADWQRMADQLSAHAPAHPTALTAPAVPAQKPASVQPRPRGNQFAGADWSLN